MGDDVVVTAVAAGRVVLGGAFTLAPRRAGQAWVGTIGARPEVAALSRALGIRDLLLGVGTLDALRRGTLGPGWLVAGAAADGTDVLGTLLAWGGLPPRRRAALAVLATGAAATQLLLAQRTRTRAEPLRHLTSVPPLP